MQEHCVQGLEVLPLAVFDVVLDAANSLICRGKESYDTPCCIPGVLSSVDTKSVIDGGSLSVD